MNNEVVTLEQGAEQEEPAMSTLGNDEAIEAMVLLCQMVKSIDGVEVSSYLKELSHQKKGLVLAKELYIQLIKAYSLAKEGANSEAIGTLEATLQAMKFEAIKLKVSTMGLGQRTELELGGVLALEQTEGNPLLNVLHHKQYQTEKK